MFAPGGGGGGGGIAKSVLESHVGGQVGPANVGLVGGAGGFGRGGAGGNSTADCGGGGGGGGGYGGGGGGGAGGGDGGGGGSVVTADAFNVVFALATWVGDGSVTVTATDVEPAEWSVAPAGSGRALATIASPPNSNAADIMRYRVSAIAIDGEYVFGGGVAWTSPWQPPGARPTFELAGLQDYAVYVFTVASSNAAGWSGDSYPSPTFATSPYGAPSLVGVSSMVVNTFAAPVTTLAASNVVADVGPLAWAVGANGPSAPPLAPVPGLRVDSDGVLTVAQHTTMIPGATVWVVAQNAVGAYSCAPLTITAYDLNAPVLATVAGSVVINTYTGAVTVKQTAQAASETGPLVASLTAMLSGGTGTFVGDGSPLPLFGLAPGVPVRVRVAASNVAGMGPFSRPSDGVIPGAPAAATAWSAALVTSSVVRVAITPPDPGAAPIVAYRASMAGSARTYVSLTPAFNIAGLPVGVPAAFTVAASNAMGWSTESAPSAPLVPYSPPGAPVHWTLERFVSGGATATIVAPATNGAPILAYELRTEYDVLVTSNAPVLCAPSVAASASLSVRASNAAGWSPFGDALPALAINTPTLFGNTYAAPLAFASAVATTALGGPFAWSVDGAFPTASVTPAGDVVIDQHTAAFATLRVCVHPTSASALTYAFSTLAVIAYDESTPVLAPPLTLRYNNDNAPFTVVVTQRSPDTGALAWSVGSTSNASPAPIAGFSVDASDSASCSVRVAQGTPTCVDRPVWLVARTAYQVAVGSFSAISFALTNVVRTVPTVAPRVSADVRALTLSVEPIDDAFNGSTDVLGYGVSNATLAGRALGFLPAGSSLVFSLADLPFATACAVGASACNLLGLGPWAWTAATHVISPPAPTGATLTLVASGTVSARAEPVPTSNAWSPVLGYAVEARGDHDVFVAKRAYSVTPTVVLSGLSADLYSVVFASSNAMGTWTWTPWSYNGFVVYTAPAVAPTLSAPVAYAPGALTVTPYLENVNANNGWSGLTGYTAATSPGGVILGTSTYASPAITVVGLTPGTTMNVYVAAVNAWGAGAWAQSAPALVKDVPQAAPTIASALVTGAGSASVTFSAVAFPDAASRGFGTVLGYVLFPSTSPTANVVGATPSTTGTCAIAASGLPAGAHDLCVAAVNEIGTGVRSPPVTVTIASVPSASPALSVTPTGSAELTVRVTTFANVNANNGYSSVRGYALASSPSVAALLRYSASTSGTLAFVIAGLTLNATYTYYAAASNVYGVGAWTQASARAIGAADAPASTMSPTSPNVLTVRVTALANDGGAATGFSPVFGYGVATAASPASVFRISVVTTGVVSFALSGLTAGAPYTYYAAASNLCGFGQWTTVTSTAVIAPTVAPVPVSCVLSASLVQTVTFTSVSDTAPSNGYAPLAGYVLVDSNDGSVAAFALAPTFVVAGRVAGREYTYYAAACNVAGIGQPSDPVTGTAYSTPTTAPTLFASSNIAAETVAFQFGTVPNVDANNGSSPITSYAVYVTSPAFALVASSDNVQDSVLTLIKTGLKTPCTYYVAAVNSVGYGVSASTSNTPYNVPSAPTFPTVCLTPYSYTAAEAIVTLPTVTDGMPPIRACMLVISTSTQSTTLTQTTLTSTASFNVTGLISSSTACTLTASVSNDGFTFNGVVYTTWSSTASVSAVFNVQPYTIINVEQTANFYPNRFSYTDNNTKFLANISVYVSGYNSAATSFGFVNQYDIYDITVSEPGYPNFFFDPPCYSYNLSFSGLLYYYTTMGENSIRLKFSQTFKTSYGTFTQSCVLICGFTLYFSSYQTIQRTSYLVM